MLNGRETGWILIDSVDQRILLLAGPIAVGKSSVVDILSREFGFRKISSGSYLVRLLESRGVEPNREQLIQLGDELDLQTNYEWVVRDAASEALAYHPEQPLWVFDSVRKKLQVEHFRGWAYGRSFLVYLSAEEATLRTRYASRQRASDSFTPYDNAVDSDNEREARSLGALADFVQPTDALPPHEIAASIIKEFTEWSKSSL